MSATEFSAAPWRKSSYSDSEGGACVEVAGLSAVVAVRDSKDPDGPKLAFGRAAFTAFAQGLRSRR